MYRNAMQAFSVARFPAIGNATQVKISMCSHAPWRNNYYYVIAVGSSDWLSSLRRTEKIEIVSICLRTLSERRNSTCVALCYGIFPLCTTLLYGARRYGMLRYLLLEIAHYWATGTECTLAMQCEWLDIMTCLVAHSGVHYRPQDCLTIQLCLVLLPPSFSPAILHPHPLWLLT